VKQNKNKSKLGRGGGGESLRIIQKRNRNRERSSYYYYYFIQLLQRQKVIKKLERSNNIFTSSEKAHLEGIWEHVRPSQKNSVKGFLIICERIFKK